MNQFLIVAYDGDDAEALSRRLSVREAHLERVRELKANGNFIEGGAILDDAGNMIGSAVIVAFPSKAELNQWLLSDPYVTGQVWQHIDIKPFRCAKL